MEAFAQDRKSCPRPLQESDHVDTSRSIGKAVTYRSGDPMEVSFLVRHGPIDPRQSPSEQPESNRGPGSGQL